jgi:nucleotide-binding universal stress UspA family protein
MGVAAARRLLVGFDGSPASLGALRRAVRTARRNHGCLIVVSVVTDSERCVVASPFGMCVAVPADPERAALQSLHEAVERVPKEVSVVTVVRHGRVGPVLVREAERHCCDAIVIGARRGVWSRLTGGVEGYLRRHGQVKLIVDRPRRRPRSRSTAAPPAVGAPVQTA